MGFLIRADQIVSDKFSMEKKPQTFFNLFDPCLVKEGR